MLKSDRERPVSEWRHVWTIAAAFDDSQRVDDTPLAAINVSVNRNQAAVHDLEPEEEEHGVATSQCRNAENAARAGNACHATAARDEASPRAPREHTASERTDILEPATRRHARSDHVLMIRPHVRSRMVAQLEGRLRDARAPFGDG